MAQWIGTADRWYGRGVRLLTHLQSGFLLLVRLFWGWQLIGAGWGKLTNIAATAQYFAGLGIPLPTANAVLSGCGEFGGGLFLLLGLASRVATLVLVVNMTVALLTAHIGVLGEPTRLITSPPFTHLLVSLMVLLFGPGIVSLDALIRHYLVRRRLVAAPSPAAAEATAAGDGVTRRDAGLLTAAAVGGLLAGLGIYRLARSKPAAPPPRDTSPVAGADAQAIKDIDAQAPPEIQPSLLLSEPHTCCGLNTCKGKAKGGGNACMGQGNCATANSHVCQGQNECKGQGGCGDYPGQNTCKSKGACAVPLKRETWPKARKRFEELTKLAGKPAGGPPPNCPKS